MRQVADQTLSGPVILDDAHFTNVIFDDAALIYSGGPYPRFTNCTIRKATLDFEGPAGHTIDFLRSLNQSAGTQVILRGVLKDIGLV